MHFNTLVCVFNLYRSPCLLKRDNPQFPKSAIDVSHLFLPMLACYGIVFVIQASLACCVGLEPTSTRCMHSKLLSTIFVNGTFCLSTSIFPHFIQALEMCFFSTSVSCCRASCFFWRFAYCLGCRNLWVGYGQLCSTLAVVLGWYERILLPSWEIFMLSMFLPCECAYFCCFVCVHLSLGATCCPHYMHGFQTFGNACSG